MRKIHVIRRRTVLAAFLAFAAAGFAFTAHPALAQIDPLPSWRDGPAKQSILDFVHVTTDRTGPKFVLPEQRIATFDQDGTLWVEHPMYTQVVYCLERIPAVVEKNPKLKNVEPFKTVLSGDREAIAKLTQRDLLEILTATLTGIRSRNSTPRRKNGSEAAKHPRWNRPYTELDLSADAGSAAIPARQRLQDLHRDRRRPGLRARLLRAGIRHPARAGRRHGRRNKVRLRQGRQADPDQGAEAAAERQRCRQA